MSSVIFFIRHSIEDMGEDSVVGCSCGATDVGAVSRCRSVGMSSGMGAGSEVGTCSSSVSSSCSLDDEAS